MERSIEEVLAEAANYRCRECRTVTPIPELTFLGIYSGIVKELWGAYCEKCLAALGKVN